MGRAGGRFPPCARQAHRSCGVGVNLLVGAVEGCRLLAQEVAIGYALKPDPRSWFESGSTPAYRGDPDAQRAPASAGLGVSRTLPVLKSHLDALRIFSTCIHPPYGRCGCLALDAILTY
jgi:hypothetical protein